jgi:hypothetical protein
MSDDDRLYLLSDVAAILGRAEGTIRNDLIRNPSAVPPCVRIPGTKGPRWRAEDIRTWIASLPTATPPIKAAPRRGRPRKSA